MDKFWPDLRFALRQLWQTPGFSITVVLMLGMGVGATTAIFSLVEGILLRPLPFHDPERLVLLGDRIGGSPNLPVTAREIGTYAESSRVFASMGGYGSADFQVAGGETPEFLDGARLGAQVFPTLAVGAELGRVFTQDEEQTRAPVAVLSHGMWLKRYHGDQQVLGRTILLDARPYTIIGVMPRDFEFPLQPGHLNHAKLWIPLSLTPEQLGEHQAGNWGFHIVARLKDGVTTQQAAQDADRVAQQVMQAFPATMASIHIRGDVAPLQENTVAEVRPLLRTLFLAVAVVLLIACANVAGLLLVRAIRRRHEYALRLALGARSGDILRESLYQGLLLSLAGGVAGLLLAAIALRTTLQMLPESMPRIASIAIDGRVAAFALLLAIAAGAVCSLAPAFAALRTNLVEGLKEGSRSGTGGSSHTRLRSALVVLEIAIALMLLTTAGAFLRSFEKMRAVDPGFKPENVVVGGYRLPLNRYGTEAAAEGFNREVMRRLASQPGVSAVGMGNLLPASGLVAGAAYTVEGEPTSAWKVQFAMFTIIDGNFFDAMGIRLLEGRTFTPDDRADTEPVVMVNESMAKHRWPGMSAVGKRMHVGNPRKGLPWATIVGVVADTKSGARDEPSGDQWYTPAEQPATLNGYDTGGKLEVASGGFIAVRAMLPTEQVSALLRQTLAGIDPLLAVDPVQPMSEMISTIEAPRKFNTGLIGVFAAGALLLALTGIYAVVTFSASLRGPEIAIRMALGAQRANIAGLILKSGARLALLGCLLGVAGSFAASKLVNAFLFEASATDPWIYGVGVLVMLLLALLACTIPAVRAASADPVKTLRTM